MAELANVLKVSNDVNRDKRLLDEEEFYDLEGKSSMIVSEFSILVNNTVAQYFNSNHYPFIYRVHEKGSYAFYDKNNIGHEGLGIESYTHATSPIRRYCDVMVQDLINAFVFEENISDKQYYSYEDKLNNVIPLLNSSQKKARVYTKKYECIRYGYMSKWCTK